MHLTLFLFSSSGLFNSCHSGRSHHFLECNTFNISPPFFPHLVTNYSYLAGFKSGQIDLLLTPVLLKNCNLWITWETLVCDVLCVFYRVLMGKLWGNSIFPLLYLSITASKCAKQCSIPITWRAGNQRAPSSPIPFFRTRANYEISYQAAAVFPIQGTDKQTQLICSRLL